MLLIWYRSLQSFWFCWTHTEDVRRLCILTSPGGEWRKHVAKVLPAHCLSWRWSELSKALRIKQTPRAFRRHPIFKEPASFKEAKCLSSCPNISEDSEAFIFHLKLRFLRKLVFGLKLHAFKCKSSWRSTTLSFGLKIDLPFCHNLHVPSQVPGIVFHPQEFTCPVPEGWFFDPRGFGWVVTNSFPGCPVFSVSPVSSQFRRSVYGRVYPCSMASLKKKSRLNVWPSCCLRADFKASLGLVHSLQKPDEEYEKELSCCHSWLHPQLSHLRSSEPSGLFKKAGENRCERCVLSLDQERGCNPSGRSRENIHSSQSGKANVFFFFFLFRFYGVVPCVWKQAQLRAAVFEAWILWEGRLGMAYSSFWSQEERWLGDWPASNPSKPASNFLLCLKS